MTARDNIRMESRFYRLVGNLPIPCSKDEAVAQLIKGGNTLLRHKVNRVTVTTSFSVVNAAPIGAPPLLFDTLIVPEDNTWQCKLWRTGSVAEAKRKHQWAVQKARHSTYQLYQDDFHIED